MGLQHAFDVLAQVVEQFERQGQSVRDVETTTDSHSTDTLDVSMTIPVSLCGVSNGTLNSSFLLERASLSDSGNITVTLSVSDLLPKLSSAEMVVDTEKRGIHVDDGKLIMTVGFRIDPTVSTAAATTTADDTAPDEEQARDSPDVDDVALDKEQSKDTTGADTGKNVGGNDDTLAARLLAAESDDVPADEGRSCHGNGGSAETVDDSDDDRLAARLAAARSDDVPAYEDTDYLRTLYESCGTFTEMSNRIEMDVAAETVRRYMIEANIHNPSSYDTATHDSERDDSDDGTEDTASVTDDTDVGLESAGPEPAPSSRDDTPEEQFVTDGIGLPEGVAVEDIVSTVVDATAVYEVQQSLDIGHEQARDLLEQLNILDLVLHRIDGQPDKVSKNDVVQRIRECEPGAA